MRKNILSRYFLLLFFVAAFSSCKARKGINVAVPDIQAVEQRDTTVSNLKAANFADSILGKQLNFSTLAVKAKASLTIAQKNNDVTLNIRMKKDEAIWISVTGFGGVEGARALITPDSVRIMDKLSNVYYKKPFSFIHRYANEQLDFNILQAILTGNTANAFLKGSFSTNQGLTLAGTIESLLYKLTYNSGFRPVMASLADQSSNQQLTVSYGGVSAAPALPQIVSLKSIAENAISLDMEYTKPILNQPVEMPFTVPKRFDVIN